MEIILKTKSFLSPSAIFWGGLEGGGGGIENPNLNPRLSNALLEPDPGFNGVQR